jgi:hypothetical protein
MKTKTAFISAMFTFFSFALFAQNEHDTVPMPPPRTDTVPPIDTARTDTTNIAFVIRHPESKSVFQNNPALTPQRMYSFAAKRNDISGK